MNRQDIAGSSRSLQAAENLDSSVIRQQCQRYTSEVQRFKFSELHQHEAGRVHGTPLDMDFLSIKRKYSNALPNSSQRTSLFDGTGVAKRIHFDSSATADSSTFSSRNLQLEVQRPTQTPNVTAKPDSTSQLEQRVADRQAAIVDLQQKLVHMEMKLSESEGKRDRLQTAFTNSEEAYRGKIKHCEDKIEDLREERKQLYAKNAELVRDNLQKKAAADKLRLNLGEEKLAYEQKLFAKEQALEEAEIHFELETKKLKEQVEQATWEAEKFRLEAEEACSKLQLRESPASLPREDSVIEHQRQVIVEMENALFAKRSTFSQTHEAQLARIPQMEKEIARLTKMDQLHRETAANQLLCNEQIESLQDSLGRVQDRCSIIPTLELELSQARAGLREWNELAGSLFGASNAEQVVDHVEQMRRKELKLVDDLGGIQLELNSANRKCCLLEEDVARLRSESVLRLELEDRMRKLERKLVVVQRDRDHYRAINEMFEKEMTHIGPPAASASTSAAEARVQELEHLLEEYRNIVSSPQNAPVDCVLDRQDFDRVGKEKQELLERVKQLEERLELAGQQADQTRVLHFSGNLLDQARNNKLQKVMQLERDNAALRERVRLMELGHSQDITMLVGEQFDQGFTPERFKELEEQLKSSEGKYQRLEDVFRKYCSSFRRGVYNLFGYQVDCDDSGNYKLVSEYRESDGDYLSFKAVGDGLTLMTSSYVRTIDDLVQLHLTTQGSIPMFLSALTVDLFSKQSINTSSFQSTQD